MTGWTAAATAGLLGLFATSSALVGAALGLYLRISKRVLACVLAFAAGALINALAIELAFGGANALHERGFGAGWAWFFIGGGFALGATVYFCFTIFLEGKGAAVRYPTRFREYALGKKQNQNQELIDLLSKCDLLRHLPPDEIEGLLPFVKMRSIKAGEILFRAGDPGDALYIVARGRMAVLSLSAVGEDSTGHTIAHLGEGDAFGEMALVNGGSRTATVRATEDSELIRIAKEDFEGLVAKDAELAAGIRRLSHGRAIENLSAGGSDPATWANIAQASLTQLSQSEADKLLSEAGKGAGMAIVLGNLLDTIPGCLVIGANFTGFESLSLTLMLGMFLGGIPEAAASGAMLSRAGYRPRAIFGMWSGIVIVGIVAAVAGNIFIGSDGSLAAIFAQALAGGAVLALVAHAMIPEAINGGGSVVVLPTVGGFLFALYLALDASF